MYSLEIRFWIYKLQSKPKWSKTRLPPSKLKVRHSNQDLELHKSAHNCTHHGFAIITIRYYNYNFFQSMFSLGSHLVVENRFQQFFAQISAIVAVFVLMFGPSTGQSKDSPQKKQTYLQVCKSKDIWCI